jgi:putative NADH-flavin reductase
MNVCVIGATGGIGVEVVRAALAARHQLSVLVRDPARLAAGDGVRVVVGDLADLESMAAAVEGCQAVIWTVGATSNTADQPPLFESGAGNLVAAMKRHDVRRLVALSGAGVTLPGERKPLRARLMSAFVARIVPHVVEAKRREYEIFAGSGLDWTLVRPPRVVEGRATGRRVVGDRLAGARVTQGDLAEVMVELLTDERFREQAPYVSS